MKTSPMSVQDFGRALLTTRDLDPVYCAIVDAKLSYRTKAKLCLAYWCFYHLGAAAAIASDENFWGAMTNAALNSDPQRRWPRGGERRHFRGQQAVLAVGALMSWRQEASTREACDPVELVSWLVEPNTFVGVSERAATLRGFGPWISFKVADMAERVIQAKPIGYADMELGVYKDPSQGAALIAYDDWQALIDPETVNIVLLELAAEFAAEGFKAPPNSNRPVSLQESETISCKYKSYVKGHYHVGKDIHEIRAGLSEFAHVPLARRLYRCMPPEVEGVIS